MDSQITTDRRCRVCEGKGAFRIAPGWMLQKCNWCNGTGANVIKASPVVRSGAWVGDSAEKAPNQCPKCKVKGWIDSSPVWGNRCRCRVCGHWFESVNAESPTVEVCDGGRKTSELEQDANRRSQH